MIIIKKNTPLNSLNVTIFSFCFLFDGFTRKAFGIGVFSVGILILFSKIQSYNKHTLRIHNFKTLLSLASSLLIKYSSGFFKTSIYPYIRLNKKNLIEIYLAYVLAQIAFWISTIYFSNDYKSNLLFKIRISQGIEGDVNYSFITTGFCLAALFILKKISLTNFSIATTILYLLFPSKGGLISMLFFAIAYKLEFKPKSIFKLTILTVTSFITGVFVFAEYASLELKQMLSSLSTYRTDIWLAKLGYEPVLYSSEYALKKQPHNFFIQLLDYNYLGLFFLIIFILNIQKSVNTITGPLVILFLFSSFSLNGGSSTIFIILLITLFNYEKNTSG